MASDPARVAYSIQRWFNTTNWGQRSDELAALEKRVAELELTWSVKAKQHGEKTVATQTPIADTTSPGTNVGGPSVTVASRGPDTVFFIYAEFDAYATNAGNSSSIAVDLYEPTLIPNGVQLSRYNTVPSSTWHSKLTAPHVSIQDFASSVPGIGRSPRGERPFVISFIPEGTYTFELRWRRVIADGYWVRNRRLWVDAQ